MRANRTFTLDVNTIQELNRRISSSSRSRFVDDAIKKKLYGADDIDVSTISTRRLMAILHNRDDVRDFVKKILVQELKFDE